jgi:hypothetical protein
MAKKKNRAFFICPRWNELAATFRTGRSDIGISAKTLSAIKEGQPVARSTLRRALEAARVASGSMFDIDAYIIDRRTTHTG